jgi:hypothetical protein
MPDCAETGPVGGPALKDAMPRLAVYLLCQLQKSLPSRLCCVLLSRCWCWLQVLLWVIPLFTITQVTQRWAIPWSIQQVLKLVLLWLL